MIHAKPLKRKHLGDMPASASSTTPSPTLDQCDTNAIPIQDQLEPAPRVDYDLNDIIELIVKALDGVSRSDLVSLVNRLYKRNNQKIPEHGVIDSRLTKLTRAGVLTRVKIGRLFYYYIKV